jgi:hypothetical protein
LFYALDGPQVNGQGFCVSRRRIHMGTGDRPRGFIGTLLRSHTASSAALTQLTE